MALLIQFEWWVTSNSWFCLVIEWQMIVSCWFVSQRIKFSASLIRFEWWVASDSCFYCFWDPIWVIGGLWIFDSVVRESSSGLPLSSLSDGWFVNCYFESFRKIGRLWKFDPVKVFLGQIRVIYVFTFRILLSVLNCGRNRQNMRRRAADYRRPVRRRFTCWIWALLGLVSVAGFVLFVVHHNHHHEDRVKHPIMVTLNTHRSYF